MVTYDLIKQCATGDSVAKSKLVEENTGLIYMVVNRFRNRGTEPEDLFQIAAVGLLKAIDRFDPQLGMQFSTYAVPLMMGEIRRHLRDDGPIKVSRGYKMLASKAAALREHLLAEKGAEPSITEIATALSVDPAELSAALVAVRVPDSLDEPYGESARPLKEQIPSDSQEEKFINHMALKQLIQALPNREKKIILLRYMKEETQAQIAKKLGISQVQVSRIEKKILEKLRMEL